MTQEPMSLLFTGLWAPCFARPHCCWCGSMAAAEVLINTLPKSGGSCWLAPLWTFWVVPQESLGSASSVREDVGHMRC